jgi:hypothetical protein
MKYLKELVLFAIELAQKLCTIDPTNFSTEVNNGSWGAMYWLMDAGFSLKC